jgi:hypothetical protein
VDAKTELAEFAMSHLRSNIIDAALGTLINGLAVIGTAIADAQERRGNWGGMLTNLKTGSTTVRSAIEYLRLQSGPAHAGLVEFADRQLRLAQLLSDEIVRLQAGESTPV